MIEKDEILLCNGGFLKKIANDVDCKTKSNLISAYENRISQEVEKKKEKLTKQMIKIKQTITKDQIEK